MVWLSQELGSRWTRRLPLQVFSSSFLRICGSYPVQSLRCNNSQVCGDSGYCHLKNDLSSLTFQMGDDLLSFKCERGIFTTQLKAFHCFELATASLFCSALIFGSVGYECTEVCFTNLHHHRWRTRKFDQEIPPSLGSKLCFTLYFHTYFIFWNDLRAAG